MDIDALFPTTPLFEAIAEGDLEAVRLLLDQGADVNARDAFDETPLLAVATSSSRLLREMKENMAAHKKQREAGEPGGLEGVMKVMKQFDLKEMMGKLYQRQPKDALSEDKDLPIVQLLIERGADLNAVGKTGTTALMSAASAGCLETARLLLDRGADPDIQNEQGKTALMPAAEERKLEIVQLLLEHGADWDRRTPRGYTTLMAAALGGRVEIARLLVSRGADVNTIGVRGNSALTCAAQYQRTEMIDYLKSQGAQVGFLEAVALDDLEGAQALPLPPLRMAHWGFPLLHSAIATGRKQAVRVLLDHGVRVDPTEEDGKKLLKYAAMRGDAELMQWLLDSNAPSEEEATVKTVARDSGLDGALHTVIRNNDLESMRLLVARGADVNVADTHGMTPLLMAVMYGHGEMATLLLELGANVHGSDQHASNPLQFAAIKGDKEIVRLLLEHGAAPRENMRAVYVQGRQNPEIKAMLEQAGGKLLHNLAAAGDIPELLAKLDTGLSADTRDFHQHTPLHFAAYKGHPKLVQKLLACGAEVDAIDLYDQTALMKAVLGSHTEVVQLLTEYRATVTQVDLFGRTALRAALLRAKPEIVQILLDVGAPFAATEAAIQGDLNTLRLLLDGGSNIEGTPGEMTPLMGAAAAGHTDCITTLLIRGADRGAVDPKGQTALHYAIQYNRKESVRLLLENRADVNLVGRDRALEAILVRQNTTPLQTSEENETTEPAVHMGRTALALAVAYDDLEIARLLLDAGADVNPTSRRNTDSPLKTAVMLGKTAAVRLLIERGADVNAGHYLTTPLQIAKQMNKFPEIIELLRQAGAKE